MKNYRIRNVNYGWCKRKHDILLQTLPQSKQDLLHRYKFFRWMKGDVQAFEVVFRIDDLETHDRIYKKVFWNPYKKTFTTHKELVSDSNLIDWNCAICKEEIYSRMDSKKIENFVCEECSHSHNSTNKVVDSRIIQSAIDFNHHCKKSLKKEQREFINYTKKSLKR